MKKNKKIILTLLITLLTASMMLVGCTKEKATVEESAKIIFNLYIDGDTSNMDKIGLTTAQGEDIVKQQKSATKATMQTSLAQSGLQFTDADIEKVCTAEANARKKIKIASAEKISGDKKTAKIKIKTPYIDYAKLSQAVSTDVIAKIKKFTETSTDVRLKKASDLFVTEMVDAMDKATASSDTKEETFTFTFRDKENVWLPENTVTFGAGVGKLVVGQN